ncbi:MAG TPA: DUF4838 domain-containing protein [Roseiflexaceae bacterium]|nr:DUF4838 domain-containing protein [Roseiflexaceae bacterium]
MAAIQIAIADDHPTIAFAAAELQRYLTQATGQPVELLEGDTNGRETSALWLGLAQHFPSVALPPTAASADARFDDAISIATEAASGVICGNNPRSVLLAVYRYLHMLGCRWVRPGVDGEYIPAVDLAQAEVHLAETPSYRHRGICIEGAVSYEHVRDLIDWMPKVGLSAYFVQFREGFCFFDRWYSHMGHPTAQTHGFTVEQARELVRQIAAEAKKRDLIYHAVGHGWTCEPLGIAGLGWEYPPEPVPPEAIQYLALVQGKRELWGGIPLNTSLCYSNPAVRQIMTDAVVEYAQQHPEVDLLHFWLADGANNQCECEHCAATRPSDFYVMMLNDADRKLSALRLDTRIVFLAYFDLLWPPEHEHIQNPDRFVLMFAPITRTYTKTFSTDQTVPELPEFERNQLTFPRSIEQNLAFLRAWQAQFEHDTGRPADSFDFDYHLMWDHYRDPAYIQIARVLHDDLQLLDTIGLEGFNSCQVQRAFFPTGLPMAVLGWTLWDKSRHFDTMARDYFAAAFGPEGQAALAYLTEISELFDPAYLRGEKSTAGEQAAASLARVAGLADSFLPTIERNLDGGTACWARSWQYLRHHAEIATALASALRERALGHHAVAQSEWNVLKASLWNKEAELHPVLDTYLFIRVYDGMFSS